MNNLILILFLCLVGHCIGDYVLQTDFIAKAKSPKFWKETNDKNGWECVTYDKRSYPEYCKDIFGFGSVTIIFHKGGGFADTKGEFFVKCDEHFLPAECFTNFKTEIEALIENTEVNL